MISDILRQMLGSGPILRGFAMIAVMIVSVPAGAANPLSGPGEPIVAGRSYEIPSAVLGSQRRVNLMLPPGYDDEKNKDQRYPVLYLLDGGYEWQDFLHISGLVHQGSLWGINEPLIVVGIESVDRRREFTWPSNDPKERVDFPTHGQSERFRTFIRTELKPLVEEELRTSGVDALMGESLAGLFVVETALRNGGDFDAYIAISPSLWWSREALSLEASALLARPAQSPRSLWLALADEGGAMRSSMDRLVAALTAKPGKVKWSFTDYPEEKHSTIYHPAATKAIRELFPPPPSQDKK